ncbi:hypothetical protein GCM10025771_13350 [Niveibacterium umoris]|uniref:DUF2059 domain-containing protein n=1 Tax=Niveibacterium umoris TaxID=1193620 RepID=A0A840BNN9_9RHOO|nr:hypothetical protein [Niveibacterium umoris]
MRIAQLALALFISVAVLPATAAEQPASEASVKRLIEITNSKKLVDNAMLQMDAMMKASMKQALADQSLTAEQEKVMIETQEKLAGLVKEELKWEMLEPMFLDIYQKTFTQKEVDGMLSFYKSPAGQAVIKKMPQVMQASMQIMQARMSKLVPQIQQITAEGAEKMKALSAQPKP